MAEAEQMVTHLKRKHRNAQREPDPEAAAHVGEFGIWTGLGGSEFRLQRHPTGRT